MQPILGREWLGSGSNVVLYIVLRFFFFARNLIASGACVVFACCSFLLLCCCLDGIKDVTLIKTIKITARLF